MLHIEGVILKLGIEIEFVEFYLYDHFCLCVRDLYLFRRIIVLCKPDFLTYERMRVVIGRYFKYIAVFVAHELTGSVAQNAPYQGLVKIHLALVLRPVALDAEALVQTRR
ncbi:hypothetical protein D3C76_1650390 [compost metagenome]